MSTWAAEWDHCRLGGDTAPRVSAAPTTLIVQCLRQAAQAVFLARATQVKVMAASTHIVLRLVLEVTTGVPVLEILAFHQVAVLRVVRCC